MIDRLVALWASAAGKEVYGDHRCARSLAPCAPAPTCTPRPLRARLEQELGDRTFEDLPVPFQVLRGEHRAGRRALVHRGPRRDAILASAAVPGLLPPAEVDGEHYLDGGIVNSIPVGRAVELGADRVFVLQVGRIDRPLPAPTQAVGGRAGDLRDRPPAPVHREMATLPEGVEAHVLPTGGTSSRDDSLLSYRDFAA